MSGEVIGFGTLAHFGATAASFAALATGWTAIGKVEDYTLPEPECDDIKTSNNDNTTNAHTYIAGMTESGIAEIKCQYVAATFTTLLAAKGVMKRYRIKFTDGSGVGIDGYLKSIKPEYDMEGIMLMSMKIKCSGDITAIATIA